LRELEAVLARAPESGEALLNRGIVEAQLGREAAAEASFRAAAAMGSAAASAELGLLHARQGRLAEAEAAYRAALAVEPGQPEAGERLARLLGRAGRFGEAAAAFGAVVAAAPDRVETRLGQALALLLADDSAAARRTLEEGLTRDAESLPLAHLLARVLAASPDPAVRDGERALALAQKVLRRESTVEHAETLAMALAELGRSAEAITWQQQVMSRLDPVADPERVAAARARLESYQRGEPVRSPWRDPS
jgi:tetratricopeptide (TPR) repeat protein